jgi:hypothetical protein
VALGGDPEAGHDQPDLGRPAEFLLQPATPVVLEDVDLLEAFLAGPGRTALLAYAKELADLAA